MNEIYAKIDQLFEENRAKDAEKYMISLLQEGIEQQNNELVLTMLNELIGYYRQASMREELLETIQSSVQLAQAMELENTIPYATTLLNVATGYRSIGMLEDARAAYKQTEEIYRRQLPENDMCYASLYNNQSLLEQEMGDFETALELQKKALEIAVQNAAGFEIAVSHTNLANTYYYLKDMENAFSHAREAIEIYDERNVKDPHYSAALTILGLCAFAKKEYETACQYLDEGMDIIKRTIGVNMQYARMQEIKDRCMEQMNTKSSGDIISGRELCKQFYEAFGRAMIENDFPDYKDRIAVGLVGEGSDCYGFDDAASRDHDWGPGFCMWVSDEVYEAIGDQLSESYNALPKEFMGYRRLESPRGSGRLGLHRISKFYERFLGIEIHQPEDLQKLDFGALYDYQLACVTNGEVFVDEEGTFTRIRETLMAGFPQSVLYRRYAESMTRFAQTLQYNYKRMFLRKDYITADRMLMQGIYHGMEIYHFMANVYPPHEKWLYQSTRRIDTDRSFLPAVEQLYSYVGRKEEDTPDHVERIAEAIGSSVANALYQVDIISDINPYLAYHNEELLAKANYVELSQKELVDRIVRLEFEAFDQVKNEGGRASCQNNWPTFSVMRKSQYLTWNHTMLLQYLYDFARELSVGHNLITEKYGRMMESTAPEKYEAIKEQFPALSEQKKMIIEEIVAIQVSMVEAFALEHPKVADNARSLHTYEDNLYNTSYETYLRGEISTYSDKMLQLYAAYVVEKASKGENIAQMTIENTARLYGFKDLEAFENTK